MIRITLDQFHDLHEAVDTVESLGVILDKGFGEVPLNIERSQFLLRGEVQMQTANKSGEISGIEFFPDFSIGPSKSS